MVESTHAGPLPKKHGPFVSRCSNPSYFFFKKGNKIFKFFIRLDGPGTVFFVDSYTIPWPCCGVPVPHFLTDGVYKSHQHYQYLDNCLTTQVKSTSILVPHTGLLSFHWECFADQK